MSGCLLQDYNLGACRRLAVCNLTVMGHYAWAFISGVGKCLHGRYSYANSGGGNFLRNFGRRQFPTQCSTNMNKNNENKHTHQQHNKTVRCLLDYCCSRFWWSRFLYRCESTLVALRLCLSRFVRDVFFLGGMAFCFASLIGRRRTDGFAER